jgi:hypothetical protein
MQKVQREGVCSLEIMTDLTNDLSETVSKMDAIDIVHKIAIQMHWDVLIEISGETTVHAQSIERSGTHIQGLQTDSTVLLDSITVTVEWLEEDGALDVLERSFIQMLLLAIRQSPLINNAGFDSSETSA